VSDRPIPWLDIFRLYHVDFAEGGRNVSKGHVAVHCPFCGTADESHHMSVSLRHGGWRCWRNAAHKGRDPARLLAALIRCSPAQAQQILGPDFVVLPDDYLASIRGKLFPKVIEPPPVYEMPTEFRPLVREPRARRFIDYLRERGFVESVDVLGLYGLRYCTIGPWEDRIIFPVYRKGKLAAWTGRSIRSDANLRYKTEGPIGDHLLWQDQLQRQTKANTIVLCEGPFDALKVRYLGRGLGITATCWFTAMPNRTQADRLHELLGAFPRRFLILDRGAEAKAIKLAGELRELSVRRLVLPRAYKDPGELDKEALEALVLVDKIG